MKLATATIIFIGIANLAWADQPTFKGVPLGAKQAVFLKAFKDFKCEPPEFKRDPKIVCNSHKETYGERPVDKVTAEFLQGKLALVQVMKASQNIEESESYYAHWKKQLSLKFGLPSKKENEFSYDGVTLISTEWEMESGGVTLQRAYPAIGASSREIVASVWIGSIDYNQKNFDRLKQKTASKTKDM